MELVGFMDRRFMEGKREFSRSLMPWKDMQMTRCFGGMIHSTNTVYQNLLYRSILVSWSVLHEQSSLVRVQIPTDDRHSSHKLTHSRS